MFAGWPAEGLDRHSIIRLSMTTLEASGAKEKTMSRLFSAIAWCFVALTIVSMPQATMAQDKSGKNCRMEQQCHWENFKKICVWVKVCR
jgi:hypothetical protein